MSARVDYDSIAPLYETRYERNDYAGVQQALGAFIRKEGRLDRQHVLEVGCGTGHWVQVLLAADVNVVGLDLSGGMLNAARTRVPDAPLIRARAEALPCQTESCDRIYSVNALHHFTDPRAFLCEARRVLRPGGGLLTIGLDPHTGQDRWWIYEYFPTALVEDRRRYLPAARIRELMAASGFSRCETRVVQHLPV